MQVASYSNSFTGNFLLINRATQCIQSCDNNTGIVHDHNVNNR